MSRFPWPAPITPGATDGDAAETVSSVLSSSGPIRHALQTLQPLAATPYAPETAQLQQQTSLQSLSTASWVYPHRAGLQHSSQPDPTSAYTQSQSVQLGQEDQHQVAPAVLNFWPQQGHLGGLVQPVSAPQSVTQQATSLQQCLFQATSNPVVMLQLAHVAASSHATVGATAESSASVTSATYAAAGLTATSAVSMQPQLTAWW